MILKTIDSSVLILSLLCPQANLGILYKYAGDPSDASTIMPISVSELRSISEGD